MGVILGRQRQAVIIKSAATEKAEVTRGSLGGKRQKTNNQCDEKPWDDDDGGGGGGDGGGGGGGGGATPFRRRHLGKGLAPSSRIALERGDKLVSSLVTTRMKPWKGFSDLTVMNACPTV